MTSKAESPTTTEAKADGATKTAPTKHDDDRKGVTPGRVAMGAAAIGSAAIAAAVLFANRNGKPRG